LYPSSRFFPFRNVLFDNLSDCQPVCLDTCNGVSAALPDDLSSFRRGLMERKAMRAISVDEIIGTSENFLTVARAYSPPDQPPTAPHAFAIAQMDIRID